MESVSTGESAGEDVCEDEAEVALDPRVKVTAHVTLLMCVVMWICIKLHVN